MSHNYADLQYLAELYDTLETRLEKQSLDLEAARLPGAEEECQTRLLVAQIVAAEKGLAQSVRDSGAVAMAPPSSPTQAGPTAALLRKRAQRLLDLVEKNAAGYGHMMSAAQASLRKIQAGGRFLDTVRGYREVQPKFIDARR